MSKELDKVKEIRDKVLYNADGYATLPIGEVNLLISITNKALQRLEAIDNANPSEALKCLESIEYALWDDDFHYQRHSKLLNTIEQALIKAEKEHKALEIIKEKNVSVWGFRNRVFGYQKKQNGNITINDTYEYYLNNFGCYHNGFDIELLTEEEFNLLKEVLE